MFATVVLKLSYNPPTRALQSFNIWLTIDHQYPLNVPKSSNRQTDRQTDQWTDIVWYRAAIAAKKNNYS